jgi:lipoprotein-anchoring transpeptidase ErfK/SrfK
MSRRKAKLQEHGFTDDPFGVKMRHGDRDAWAMSTRRHAAPRRHRRLLWAVLISLSVLAVMAGGTAYAGYRYEQNRSAQILPGVLIAGVDVSGMTRSQAKAALQPSVARILGREIGVEAAGKTWQVTAEQLGTAVDISRALDQAFELSAHMSWTSRLSHRLFDHPLNKRFDIVVNYEHGVVAGFVKNVARTVHAPPRTASLDFIDGRLLLQHSRPGTALKARPAVGSLMDALQGSVASVSLATKPLRPAVTDDSLGMTIIVRVSENRLYLYDGLKLVKSYPVATAKPGYTTPTGHWTIINKRVNPTWVNPAKDTWGANEPDFIPPGPDNPLGTRALDLDASGIRIHGTPDDASIGTYASHGCIRMHISDSEDLFARVGVGTRVIIAA